MKKNTTLLFLFLTSGGLVSSLALEPAEPNPTVVFQTDLKTPANLFDPDRQPRAYFEESRRYMVENDYDTAYRWFALGLVTCVYDKLRVEDTTAHQILTIMLTEIFDGINTEPLGNTVYKDQTTARFNEFCQQVREMGPPTYEPGYMIDHGMAAIIEGLKREAGQVVETSSGTVKDFNPTEAWAEAIKQVMSCEK